MEIVACGRKKRKLNSIGNSGKQMTASAFPSMTDSAALRAAQPRVLILDTDF
jgi:hypothetical protein